MERAWHRRSSEAAWCMATFTSARSSSAAYVAPAAATRALPSATAASAVKTSTSARLHCVPAPASGAQASCTHHGQGSLRWGLSQKTCCLVCA